MKTVDEALEVCRRRGYRLTPQRTALLELLSGRTDHPSAADLLAEVRQRYPSTSSATVYNTLELLDRLELVQVLHIDPDRTRYDPDTGSHAHAWCRWCGKVSDFDAGDLDTEMEAHLPSGFLPDEVELNVRGVCSSCQ